MRVYLLSENLNTSAEKKAIFNNFKKAAQKAPLIHQCPQKLEGGQGFG